MAFLARPPAAWRGAAWLWGRAADRSQLLPEAGTDSLSQTGREGGKELGLNSFLGDGRDATRRLSHWDLNQPEWCVRKILKVSHDCNRRKLPASAKEKGKKQPAGVTWTHILYLRIGQSRLHLTGWWLFVVHGELHVTALYSNHILGFSKQGVFDFPQPQPFIGSWISHLHAVWPLARGMLTTIRP